MKKIQILLWFVACYVLPTVAIVSQPMPNQRQKFMEIEPTVTQYNPNGIIHFQLDPDSVRAVYPELVTTNGIINYNELVAIMVSLVQLLLEHENGNNSIVTAAVDIQPMPNQRNKFLQLEPIIVKFSPSGTVHYQLDANSVRAVYPELITSTGSINYTELLVIIISLVQQLLEHENNVLLAVGTQPMPNQRHKFLQLEPVIVKFSPTGLPHYQLDVNSVRAVYPELVTANGIINYTELEAITISLVQQLLQHGNLGN